MFSIIMFLILSISLSLYLYIKSFYNYWANHGIPQENPSFPLGNLTRGKNFFLQMENIYFKAKNINFPFLGVYFMHRPVAMATDLDLIRSVLIKDFNNFVNRNEPIDEKASPMSLHLVHAQSEKWRFMRTILSPTFSSGKMKFMYPTMVAVGEQLVQCLNKMTETGNEFEMRDVICRYSIDIIGNIGFGIECNSLKDPDNVFRQMGKTLFDTPKWTVVERMIMAAVGPFVKSLRIQFNHVVIIDFFKILIKDTIDYRKKTGLRRKDFMDSMIQLMDKGYIDDEKYENAKPFTFMEIAPHAFGFFAGGFETTSTSMTYILYELAQDKNQFIQEKYRKEIETVLNKFDDNMSYDALKEMCYVEQVMDETFRKYSPVGGTSRFATNDYVYKKGNKTIKIPKGARVFISFSGIHHDPEYYPNPDVFDPNRFSPEEIAKRPSCTFLPFSAGPRNCIRVRFSKLETKIGLVCLLKNFIFTTCARTEPQLIQFDSKKLLLSPRDGIWLKIHPV